MNTLYKELSQAGVEIDHHESDLYFLPSPEALDILSKYPNQSRSYFTNNIDGRQWIDATFAYDPFWDNKAK